MRATVASLLLTILISHCIGQRIQTVEIGDSRYFISDVSPYSPTLNWFLAYEYCRNIGMELLAIHTAEENNIIKNFLQETNKQRSDYWTSGNQLGSEMWLWMSTGQPFNNTFDFWVAGGPPLTKSQQACMSTSGEGVWNPNNCMDAKQFICEQTRCFYYNYVTTNRASSTQGNRTLQSGDSRVTQRPAFRPVRVPVRRITRPPIANSTQEQETQTQGQQQIRVRQEESRPGSNLHSNQSQAQQKMDTFNQSQESNSPSTTPSSLKVMVQTTLQALKIMPTRAPLDPVKQMPESSTQQSIKQMSVAPTEQAVKQMTNQSSVQPLKQMPTQSTAQPLKQMPGTPPPGQAIKVMPANVPDHQDAVQSNLVITDSSTAAHTNEIIPTEYNPLLRELQPPTIEFTPGDSQRSEASQDLSGIMDNLSRKETFSWALSDDAPR